MDKKLFYDMGLTKGEVEVYLALLKIGYSSIGKIVEESKVTKSKIYDILYRLKDKGLVSIFVKNNVHYYNAASPNFLNELINKKEQIIHEQQTELQKILPSLLSMQSSSSKKERAEIYEGFQGLKNAFEIISNEFENNEEFLVLGVDKTLTQQQLNFFIQYHKRKTNAKIRNKVIFTSNLRGIKEYHLKQDKYNEERYLNQMSAVPINIYKHFVLIPLFEKGQKETTILIHNKKLAEGFREYFYTLWKISKP